MNSFITSPSLDGSYWHGKRVVITGGSGFIGSHLAERLVPVCGQIVVPTRQAGVPSHLRHLASAVEFVHGDLREKRVAQAACQRADILLCLAAVVGGIEYNNAHHASIFRDNLTAYLACLEAARSQSVSRVLVCSSACVYPRHCQLPTPESDGFVDRPEPTNEGYGWAKRMEEFLGAAYAKEYALSIAVARPYNAYGPRDDFNPATSHVIPALIRKAFAPDTDKVVVWGSGRQSRSFLYVTDFVDGLIRICEKATNAEPTNLGADEETTIGDVARLILEYSGTGKTLEFDQNKPEGQPRRHCDTTRLESLFGYRTRVSLADGLRLAVQYYREEVARCE